MLPVPKKNLHLRVEDAGGPLDDRDGLVIGGDSEDGVLRVPQDSDKLEAKVLGVQLGGESIRHGLLCASGDLNGVLLGSEVADNLRLAVGLLKKGATNDAHTNGLGFGVGDGQTSFGGMTVDELDAENLRLRERG